MPNQSSMCCLHDPLLAWNLNSSCPAHFNLFIYYAPPTQYPLQAPLKWWKVNCHAIFISLSSFFPCFIKFPSDTAFDIVRNYKKWKGHTHTPAALMKKAVELVIKVGRSEREVSRELGEPRTTLQRYIKQAKDWSTIYARTLASRRVFTDEQEVVLNDRLTQKMAG